ncbi:hypothetical protein GE09DRAFT_57696 [Coniochaeta sp. 2T2.1]|nr:hypothetical protein GE09DRAFT_57696 [Coniochaeta sp. 2T2.1]
MVWSFFGVKAVPARTTVLLPTDSFRSPVTSITLSSKPEMYVPLSDVVVFPWISASAGTIVSETFIPRTFAAAATTTTATEIEPGIQERLPRGTATGVGHGEPQRRVISLEERSTKREWHSTMPEWRNTRQLWHSSSEEEQRPRDSAVRTMPQLRPLTRSRSPTITRRVSRERTPRTRCMTSPRIRWMSRSSRSRRRQTIKKGNKMATPRLSTASRTRKFGSPISLFGLVVPLDWLVAGMSSLSSSRRNPTNGM